MGSVRAISVLHRVVCVPALLCVLVGVLTLTVSAAGAEATNSLSGVACPSVSQCTSVDSAGREVTFSPTSPGDPTPTPIDSSESLVAVACPSVSQCTAVDNAGREVTFNPTSPGNPTPTRIDGSAGISAVACPSVSQCTAVDSAGREVTFDPTALGTPTPATIDGSQYLRAVACPSVSQCTAVDNNEHEITFDPAAPGNPAAVTVDQPRFCGSHCVKLGYVDGIACPSVAQCTAIDDTDREVTFNPTAPGKPTPTNLPAISHTANPLVLSLPSVTCPSVSQCIAIEEGGEITFDPNALGSPTPTTIDSGVWLRDVACPSSSQCTAVEEACPWVTATLGCATVEEPCGEVTFNPNAPETATRSVIDSGCLVTAATPPPTAATPTPTSGIAKAAASARVKRGVATIKLTCTGSSACEGVIKLLAHIAGKRTVAIGTAPFSIATGASQGVRVHLSRQGMALVLKAGRRGLKVKVGGSDVRARSLLL
jgi:hypothetical protein